MLVNDPHGTETKSVKQVAQNKEPPLSCSHTSFWCADHHQQVSNLLSITARSFPFSVLLVKVISQSLGLCPPEHWRLPTAGNAGTLTTVRTSLEGPITGTFTGSKRVPAPVEKLPEHLEGSATLPTLLSVLAAAGSSR